MVDDPPGVSGAVQLVSIPAKTKPLNLDQCVICQKAKDSKGSDKLTSTTEGRQVIIKSSEKLQDGLFERIGIQNGDNINSDADNNTKDT